MLFRSGGGNELVNEVLADHQLVAFPIGNTGCQMAGWFRKEINSAADLRGLKLRVSGFAGMILQSLGVEPQGVARAEIANALASGALDGAAWVSPFDDEKLELLKVAPNYYYPGFFQPSMAMHLIVSAQKWNELPSACKAMLQIGRAHV